MLLFLGYSDGCIGIYRVTNLERTKTLADTALVEERLPVGAIRYLLNICRWHPKVTSKKELVLVSAGVDGVISYWNPLSGKLIATIRPEKKFSDLLCLDYSNDGSKLAAAGRRKAIKVFDDSKKTLITKLRPKGQQKPGHSNRIFAVKCSERGKK